MDNSNQLRSMVYRTINTELTKINSPYVKIADNISDSIFSSIITVTDNNDTDNNSFSAIFYFENGSLGKIKKISGNISKDIFYSIQDGSFYLNPNINNTSTYGISVKTVVEKSGDSTFFTPSLETSTTFPDTSIKITTTSFNNNNEIFNSLAIGPLNDSDQIVFNGSVKFPDGTVIASNAGNSAFSTKKIILTDPSDTGGTSLSSSLSTNTILLGGKLSDGNEISDSAIEISVNPDKTSEMNIKNGKIILGNWKQSIDSDGNLVISYLGE